MAPKPRPLDQLEVVLDENRFGGVAETSPAYGNTVRTGGFAVEQQENMGGASANEPIALNHNEKALPLQVENSKGIIQGSHRTTPWYLRKKQLQQQRDPNGHKMSRKSMSPSNALTCSIGATDSKSDPPETRQQPTPLSKSVMLREGDLLDRTFDNVENVTCHGRPSPKLHQLPFSLVRHRKEALWNPRKLLMWRPSQRPSNKATTLNSTMTTMMKKKEYHHRQCHSHPQAVRLWCLQSTVFWKKSSLNPLA